MNCKEKVCLVTGGVSGIGKAIVISLLENGVKHITVVDINEKLGNELIATVEKKYGHSRLSFSKTNVANAQELERVYQKIVNIYEQLDIVVNNAGEARENDYELMISINLVNTKAGVISFVRGVATEDLINKKGVRIICLCPGYTPGTNLFNNFSEEYKKNEAELLKSEKRQPADAVARAAMEMLKNAKTGSIWVVDGG